MAIRRAYEDSVFINCPFDPDYLPMFEVIVFTVFACGFSPCCAREEDDASDVRVEKIVRLIESCRFGIHDISRIGLEQDTGLPRFNMPFELGLDLGCKKFGQPRNRQKRLLILDAKPYRYKTFLSDIGGQDIRAHDNKPDQAISIVRDWLRTASTREKIPGDLVIRRQFEAFTQQLPEICAGIGLQRANLNYLDYVTFTLNWLRENRDAAARHQPAR